MRHFTFTSGRLTEYFNSFTGAKYVAIVLSSSDYSLLRQFWETIVKGERAFFISKKKKGKKNRKL